MGDGAAANPTLHLRVRLPLPDVVRLGRDGVPYQAPEITLLFKARHARAKDVDDLERVWPRLDAEARRWLREALVLTEPEHRWLGPGGRVHPRD